MPVIFRLVQRGFTFSHFFSNLGAKLRTPAKNPKMIGEKSEETQKHLKQSQVTLSQAYPSLQFPHPPFPWSLQLASWAPLAPEPTNAARDWERRRNDRRREWKPATGGQQQFFEPWPNWEFFANLQYFHFAAADVIRKTTKKLPMDKSFEASQPSQL